ncbi:MAG TPA: hypothetical protein VGG41_21865 [Solirubrobacteraceae bacterium]|jgi:hypothetical protein
MTLAAAIVDTHALLEMVYVSVIAGIGICIVYALAVLAITRAQEHRRADHPRTAAIYGALATISVGVCGWAVVTGITIMAKK